MSNQPFLQGEMVVMNWGTLTVTTHRVMFSTEGGGVTHFTSLCADRIDGVAFRRQHHPWLLAAAGFFVLLAMLAVTALDAPPLAAVSVLAAMCSAVAYIAGRKVAVLITAGASRIEVNVDGGAAQADAARALLLAVEDTALRARGTVRVAGAGVLRAA